VGLTNAVVIGDSFPLTVIVSNMCLLLFN